MRHLTPWSERRLSTGDFFSEMERMFEDFTRNSDFPVSSGFNPVTDVEEEEGHYLMTIDLPGMKKEDIKIDVKNNVLTISGERKRETNVSEGKKGQRFERSYGSFTRSFTLPSTVNADDIEARYEDGVLSLFLPKTPETQARKIEIESKAGGFFDKLLHSKKDEVDVKTERKEQSH
ncbi:Hsp20/alpha crystallin family protein [Bdellovibrio bacteriovorus]